MFEVATDLRDRCRCDRPTLPTPVGQSHRHPVPPSLRSARGASQAQAGSFRYSASLMASSGSVLSHLTRSSSILGPFHENSSSEASSDSGPSTYRLTLPSSMRNTSLTPKLSLAVTAPFEARRTLASAVMGSSPRTMTRSMRTPAEKPEMPAPAVANASASMQGFTLPLTLARM